VALVVGDRFLAPVQTLPVENGIYVWNGPAVPATRATDADTGAELAPNTVVLVSEGATLADTSWTLTTDAPITVGVTALTFLLASLAAYARVLFFPLPATAAGVGIPLVHNFGHKRPFLSIADVATDQIGGLVDTVATNPTTVTVTFPLAITAGQYVATVIG
jgi:hypothetical protein